MFNPVKAKLKAIKKELPTKNKKLFYYAFAINAINAFFPEAEPYNLYFTRVSWPLVYCE